jgi:hypothetical protein
MSTTQTTAAGAAGKVKVKLLVATPVDAEDKKAGDVVSVDANSANILIGYGLAESADPPAPPAPPGKLFKSGEKTPHTPPPAAAASASAPAPATPAPAPAPAA